MNRNNLKSYAPQARCDFIQAVRSRAAHYGLTAEKIEPMTVEGDVTVIGGQPYPQAVGDKRKNLEDRIRRDGFEQTMEAMAYTWFNRLVAIRFMELHGYLEHGYRVLSHPEGHHMPEIVDQAEHVDLPGLDNQRTVDLKMAATAEEELYRILLIAQCNALHKAMPFLFESINDETELLLPDHLLHSDSLIRNLVNTIPEEDWQEVEIIGWLYQFYISEKKDQVIGKVVKSEDIPAATQLFTPNWIVKYLVQNSLGRQWVATYPNSPLKEQMEYYIEPAEQTPEVQAQLDEITTESLNPEELTLLDPACGSGHILVEAYDLLKAIYQERGYRPKDIPRLILEMNLYGLEIDDRAAQLAAFALMMKARADDRRIFGRGVQPHVLAIRESKGLDAQEITEALNQPILKEKQPPSGELFEEVADERSPLFSRKAMGVKGAISQADVAHLIELFENGKTFGSLIQVPEAQAEKLPALAQRVEDVVAHGDMFDKTQASSLRFFVELAQMLAGKYDAVVMNPPYMGNRYCVGKLREFVNTTYSQQKYDLYGCFMRRGLELCLPSGSIAMITIPNWMFLAAFKDLRAGLLSRHTISSLIHNGRGVFGSDFGTCSFVILNTQVTGYLGSYRRLFFKQGSVASVDELRRSFKAATTAIAAQDDFLNIPGTPIAYSLSKAFRSLYGGRSVEDLTYSEGAVKTGNNDKYLRMLWEVSADLIGPAKKWRLHPKGGDFRKWSGNVEWVVDWSSEARLHYKRDKVARTLPEACWDLPGICWTEVSIGKPSFRLLREDEIANNTSLSLFVRNGKNDLFRLLGFFNSNVARHILSAASPTLHYLIGDIQGLPFPLSLDEVATDVDVAVRRCVQIASSDWDVRETAYGFVGNPVVSARIASPRLSEAIAAWQKQCEHARNEMRALETAVNTAYMQACDVDHELEPIVMDDEVTLWHESATAETTCLISYAVGCTMGRYSLAEPGLIYAHSGNVGFDPSKYKVFPADEDGIVPLTEFHWFDEDAARRFEKFIATAWPKNHLEENLKFVAESLGQKRAESPRDTIRRYFAADFYKHHLSLYKKRPIYWLFSSGKQRGFQALVYLHRYNEGTLARMRTQYVVPLLGKMRTHIERLTDDIPASTSSAHRKRLEKEQATASKQLAEVQKFEENLRHYADQRINLDLDDGVMVNYGKFGDLLAEVKKVTGKEPE